MSPLAGPVAAAAVIFARGTRIPEVDDSKRLDAGGARAAGARHPRARARLGGRLRRGRRDRLHQHLLGRAGRRCAGRSRRSRPAAEHLLIDGRRLRDVAAAAAEHHQGRRQEPVDRGGVDPRQDGARRAHARARRRVSRIRLRPAQGLSGERALPRASAAWAPARSTGDRSRSCARCSACRRCRRGRCARLRRGRRIEPRHDASPTARERDADRVARDVASGSTHAATRGDRCRPCTRQPMSRKSAENLATGVSPSTTMLIA